MRRFTLLAAVLVVVSGLVACGDDDGSASDSTAGSSTTAPADALTGEPVRLMAIADLKGLGEDFSNLEGGARAAADGINREGGIDGRPVEIEVCDAERNANAAAACARQAVEKGFSAVVGSTTTQGGAYLPILEAAGIPSIANLGVSGVDFQNPVAYPITLGTAGYAVAMGSLAAEIGAKQVGVAYVDIEGGQLAAGAVGLGLGANGLELANSTPVAPNTPDLSTAYAAASDGVDAIAMALTTADATRFVVAAEQAGGDVDLIVPQAALDPTSVTELGSAAEGVYVVSFFLPASDEYEEMAAVVADFDAAPTTFTRDDVAINAWAGVRIFAMAAEQASDLSGPAIKTALDGLGQIDLGIVPAFSFQTPVAGVPTFARTFNAQVMFNRVEEGVTVPLTGDFVNPFDPRSS